MDVRVVPVVALTTAAVPTAVVTTAVVPTAVAGRNAGCVSRRDADWLYDADRSNRDLTRAQGLRSRVHR